LRTCVSGKFAYKEKMVRRGGPDRPNVHGALAGATPLIAKPT